MTIPSSPVGASKFGKDQQKIGACGVRRRRGGEDADPTDLVEKVSVAVEAITADPEN
ncbi:hypothetical protein FH972_010404 [Carpinus fangiana]|uniref:Uncharacterized protein n=1 Tax=Carpinus fangiana TaxID=176857 RepID=A0A660KUA0_9ROSI|nr:hypothetical protein FH972_010404 [Carpinus fangiana]